MTLSPSYIGRFAPSPTGPLHAGSLVAALASWLDARAHGGQWLVRIEDIDPPRCQPGADTRILAQLHALGLVPDAPPVWQSQRGDRYQQALDRLVERGLAYPCGCTRRDIEAAVAAQQPGRPRHSELVYPGTCRHGLHGQATRAWRVRTTELPAGVSPATLADEAPHIGSDASGHWTVAWLDRRLGDLRQDLTQDVGDFVLRRADGLWAYQLAVVVDDGEQAITHIVRGGDLTDNTPRQLWLQRLLGLPHPAYLHVPLVLDAQGEKLSKQHGAPAIDTGTPAACRQALDDAARALSLPPASAANGIAPALAHWVAAWGRQYINHPKIA
ncbi:MAG: Glutamyl-Q tRNA(Asp) synthetase [Paracidovorax wautersii]|uniref:Glutamyl-Q tRNA(Asp) synthetase n=1 Tax=Paracidovorax wautersii TaxID=1177982 RepID=A0A7V8JR93_9BURK|nr:MAG: Glutamyl-Q tRNA(Asp) synthetase [Paracidovorax wautersii]